MHKLTATTITLSLLLGVHGACAEPLTDSEKRTLRDAHDTYVKAIADRNVNSGHQESGFAIAMQKHSETEQLAAKIGRENRTDAIPFLLELKDQAFLRSFVNSNTAPTTPEVEALVLQHIQDPSLHPREMNGDILHLIRQYHTRAMFDALLTALKEELNAPPDRMPFASRYGVGATTYLAEAIVKTDLPGIEPDLAAALPRLDAYSGAPIAKLLAERRYQPTEAALIDFLRRTPVNTNNQMIVRSAGIILPFASQAVQDAVLQQMIAISRVNHREEEVEGLASALEMSPPWVKLNRRLLSGKVLPDFTPAEAARVAAMLKVRDAEEKRADEITPDNLAHWCTHLGDTEMVSRFIKGGVDVNAQTSAGERPMLVAVAYFNFEAMRILLDAGADPNTKDRMGRTALLMVSGDKSFDDGLDGPTLAAAKTLIKKHADVSLADPGGWTPLHVATAGKFRRMVELLVESGVNVNAEAFERPGGSSGLYGLTPLQLAEDQGNTEIAAYLRSKGATVSHSFAAKRAAQRAAGAIMAPFLGNMH